MRKVWKGGSRTYREVKESDGELVEHLAYQRFINPRTARRWIKFLKLKTVMIMPEYGQPKLGLTDADAKKFHAHADRIGYARR